MTTSKPRTAFLAALATGAVALATAVALSVATTTADAGTPVPRTSGTITLRPADYLCSGLNSADTANCHTLMLRDEATRTLDSGAITYDPAGPALVARCLHYSGSELSACLAQPTP